MTNEKNKVTELSDEELMELTGGVSFMFYGICMFYDVFPAQAITAP